VAKISWKNDDEGGSAMRGMAAWHGANSAARNSRIASTSALFFGGWRRQHQRNSTMTRYMAEGNGKSLRVP